MHRAVKLQHEDHQERRWAARDLVKFPEANKALVDRLQIETHPSVRTALLGSLTQLGDDVSITGVISCLRSDDAALRNEAIEVLKAVPDKVALTIDNLLHDSDSDVRIFAINILESLRHEDVEKWLIQVLDNDSHVNVCATAIDLLAEIGTEIAVSSLEKVKKRFENEPYVCFSADLALKRIQQGDH